MVLSFIWQWFLNLLVEIVNVINKTGYLSFLTGDDTVHTVYAYEIKISCNAMQCSDFVMIESKYVVLFNHFKIIWPFATIYIFGLYKKPCQSLENSSTLSRSSPRKRCSKNVQQIYRRTPMPKCDFNKLCNFFETTLRYGSSANLLHIFRITFYKNTSWELLLAFKPYIFLKE